MTKTKYLITKEVKMTFRSSRLISCYDPYRQRYLHQILFETLGAILSVYNI